MEIQEDLVTGDQGLTLFNTLDPADQLTTSGETAYEGPSSIELDELRAYLGGAFNAASAISPTTSKSDDFEFTRALAESHSDQAFAERVNQYADHYYST